MLARLGEGPCASRVHLFSLGAREESIHGVVVSSTPDLIPEEHCVLESCETKMLQHEFQVPHQALVCRALVPHPLPGPPPFPWFPALSLVPHPVPGPPLSPGPHRSQFPSP